MARTPSPDDTIFVALGKDLKEGDTVLMWALHNSKGRKICIIHIHQPDQRIPMMGSKVSISKVGDHQVRAHHENERQLMHKILDKYIWTCARAGARAEKLHLEMDSVEKGIVQIISDYGIKWLVMGAAAKKSYSRKMTEPKSKKAKYVHLKAPTFCLIWFVCKGHLIHTRESKLGGVDVEMESASLQASPCIETAHSPLRSDSVTEGHNVQPQLNDYVPAYHMDRSENRGMELSAPSDVSGGVTPLSRLNLEGSIDWETLSRRCSSVGSHFSTSQSEIIEDSTSISLARIEESEIIIEEGIMKDELYDRLKQFMMEAESAWQEAYEESIRRKKAEKDVIDAIHRAKVCDSMLAEELRYQREIEEALARDKEEVEHVKYQLDEVMKELEVTQDQKSILDCQIANFTQSVEKLEQEMFSTIELLQKFRNEKDELKVEHDNALRVANELRKKQDEETSSSSASQYFSEFSFAEIEVATSSFDESLKIGEGRYGIIYKGLLRYTQVAIKMLHPNSLQGLLEFQHEVNILSKLRHPNLATLIGVCEEELILVYEYLPNGSLEDRLNCKDNTFPLSWQTRIRIATELCSALIFLHSSCPRVLVHGVLNPANILLDANFVVKLNDFGICRDEFSDNSTSLCTRADPRRTFVYMDPEFLATGELTSKSDIYSFGITLLRLLTGRPASGITKEVLCALDEGNLKDLLDPTAGDWPFVQAKQLTHLAISCCEMNSRRRPDLVSDIWRVLKPMGASYFQLGSKEFCQIPSYFICPIFQEIMQDPVVAADGFTYEAEALKGWLETGHDTSPMTNLKLAHCNSVPNHALRSTIQEWLQQP
ncbi:U-box domain-containing protein 33 [Forsythia ovata]|uniref:RING-type E3 ubiquitin transferase n=1 Tax=Forsythia ovata TaxID=205694 RepID=A0ABD1PYQ4_9LAMI